MVDIKNINDLEYKKFILDADWNIALNAVIEWTAATVDVWTTTTWDAWTSASVTNSWTTSAAIFDFTIPKWDQWIQWPQGIKWDTWDKGMNWQWVYDGTIQYYIDDAVSYEDSSYIAIQDTKWNVPTDTTYWNLVAKKGADWSGSWDVSQALRYNRFTL